MSLSCWNVKGEEEEEEVDQVVAVVEVCLVLAHRAIEAQAQAGIEAVAIEVPVAAALLALCSTLERRSPKPTLILSHPTPNNNLEDPIQVSKGIPTQILNHPTPNNNSGPIRLSKADPDNNQAEAVLEAVDLSIPVTDLEESTRLVKITSVTLAVVDLSTQEATLAKITLVVVDLSTQEAATKDTEPTLDLTSEVEDLTIGTIMVPQITATIMAVPTMVVPTMVVPTMVVVIVTITIEATFIPAPTTTVLDPAMVVRIMDTMAVACSTTNTGNLEACLAEAKNLSPLEPELDFWVGQWRVWPPCRCIIDTECIPA